MVNPGDIVRTNTWGWDERYAGQHFLVTRVEWDADHMKHVLLLQDHIGGGFIWANEEEVKEEKMFTKMCPSDPG
jgi:hypothetical protein